MDQNSLEGQLLSRAQGIKPLSSLDKTIEDPSGLVPMAGSLQAIGEAEPTLVNLLRNFKVEDLANAKGALYNLLTSFKAGKVNPQSVVESVPTYMGRSTAPTNLREMYNATMKRVPEAKGLFAEPPYLSLSRSPNVAASYEREKAFRNAGKVINKLPLSDAAPQASADFVQNMRVDPRAIVRPENRPIVQNNNTLTDRALGRARTKLALNGLTEETIRDIRQLGLEGAIKKYPKMKPVTLRDIVRGDTYAWVK